MTRPLPCPICAARMIHHSDKRYFAHPDTRKCPLDSHAFNDEHLDVWNRAPREAHAL